MPKRVLSVKTFKYLLLCAFFLLPVLAGCSGIGSAGLPEMKPGFLHAEFEGTTDKGASFLVCGTGGRLDRIFEDGTVETIPLPVENKDLIHVLVGENITLVCGESGAFAYSLDGGEFKLTKGMGKEHILGLTQFQGKYFACTYSGKILASDDGISWKFNSRLTKEPIISIATDGAYMMAITKNTDIYKSNDGMNWEPQNYNKVYEGLAAQLIFSDMVHVDGTFFVLGYNVEYPDIPSLIYTNDVGEIWTSIEPREINGLPPEEFFPLTYNSVCFFAGELLAACDHGRVLTITDCPTCNLIMEATSADLRCMAIYDNTLLVAGDNFEFEILDAAELRQNSISPEQALIEMDYGAVVIDVRTDEEYNAGHIKDCVHIPVDEIESRLLYEVPDMDSLLIFYCAVGARAQTALETAQQLGYQHVYNLGGFSDWPYETE